MAENDTVFKGERLRKVRKSIGMKQAPFAELVDIDQSKISMYETGKADPNLETLIKLAKTLGVSSDYFLGLVDNPGQRLTDSELSPREYQLVIAHRQKDLRYLMQLASQQDA